MKAHIKSKLFNRTRLTVISEIDAMRIYMFKGGIDEMGIYGCYGT